MKRSITIKQQRTSISIEPEFLEELRIWAVESGRSINELVMHIGHSKPESLSLTSAVRVEILKRLRNR